MSKGDEEEKTQDTFHDVIEAIDSVEVEPDRHISIQIDDSLREAIVAAQSSNKGASVTVTINVKPEQGRRISFAAKVTSKLPRPSVSAATLYADANGHVHRSDPAQTRLEFYDAARTRKQES